MFITIAQCKKIIQSYLANSGRGGFITGTVTSVNPLTINAGQRLEISSANAYIADNCIGLKVNGKELRPALKVGDGVLIISRPDATGGTKYIIFDRIQKYQSVREVSL